MTTNRCKLSDRPSSHALTVLLVFACSVFGNMIEATAEDTVTVRSATTGKTRQLTGTIVDFDAKQLTLRTSSGREQSIGTASVVNYQTTWPDEINEAKQLYNAQQFAEAASFYRQALEKETRPWARCRLQSDLVWCYRNAKRPGEACNEFFRLLAIDTTQQYFDAIPLAWQSQRADAGLDRRARTWLEHEEPVVVLMGASWLASVERAASSRALQALTTGSDARTAQLAATQLWSTQLATATPDDVENWLAIIGKMPTKLRAGPTFVAARAMAQQGKHEEAALLLMRLPTLHSRDYQLCAESLQLAADQLVRLGRMDEAASLYRELLAVYPDTLAAATAKSKLDAAASRANDK